MDGKVFTKETKKLMKKGIDNALQLPFYLEWADGPAAGAIIDIVDKKADKYIPDDIDPLINSGITKAFDGNLEGAATDLGIALNKVIDIPLVAEDTEQGMCVSGIQFLLHLFVDWVDKKNN